MVKPKVLLIEDNKDTRHFLETVLNREFETVSAESSSQGLEIAVKQPIDLIILDVLLPTTNGFETCSVLKKNDKTKAIPIIFLSAKSSINDIVKGFELGADDYIAKPFDHRELIARMKVRLRDKFIYQDEPKTLTCGELRLVLDSRDSFYSDKPVRLTETEFDILRVLIQSRGEVLTRDQIIEKVWKTPPQEIQKRTIDVHIRAIRKKIPALTKNLISVYGEGYKFQV